MKVARIHKHSGPTAVDYLLSGKNCGKIVVKF